MPDPLHKIISEIITERFKQDEKRGQDHDPHYWMSVLMEKGREISHEIVGENCDYDFYRKELIKIAAVAVAAIESFDRNIKNS